MGSEVIGCAEEPEMSELIYLIVSYCLYGKIFINLLTVVFVRRHESYAATGKRNFRGGGVVEYSISISRKSLL